MRFPDCFGDIYFVISYELFKASELLQKLHTRTLVRKYVKGITPEKKAQVSLWLVRCWVIDGQPLRHMVGEMEHLNYEVA